jgi:hypothetical protein
VDFVDDTDLRTQFAVYGWLAFGLVLLSCQPPVAQGPGVAQRMPTPSPRPAPVLEVPVPSDAGAPRDDASGGPSPSPKCVAHAGQSERRSVVTTSPGGTVVQSQPTGSCAADVECVRRYGVTTPGDELARISCDGLTCTCSVDTLSPVGNRTFRVDLDAPCTSFADAKALLFGRCLDGSSAQTGGR